MVNKLHLSDESFFRPKIEPLKAACKAFSFFVLIPQSALFLWAIFYVDFSLSVRTKWNKSDTHFPPARRRHNGCLVDKPKA